RPAEMLRAPSRLGHPPAGGHVRRGHGGPLMLLPIVVFFLGAGLVVGAYALITFYLPGALKRRELDRRFQELTSPSGSSEGNESTIVKRLAEGPLPSFDRAASKTGWGSWLSGLIAQSGVRTTASAVLLMTILLAVFAGLLAMVFLRFPFAPLVAALIGAALPIAFLLQRRSARLKKFEEQFPEALDLLARAIRAGHAFQTAMGMVAEELPKPVGPEFKQA